MEYAIVRFSLENSARIVVEQREHNIPVEKRVYVHHCCTIITWNERHTCRFKLVVGNNSFPFVGEEP